MTRRRKSPRPGAPRPRRPRVRSPRGGPRATKMRLVCTCARGEETREAGARGCTPPITNEALKKVAAQRTAEAPAADLEKVSAELGPALAEFAKSFHILLSDVVVVELNPLG